MVTKRKSELSKTAGAFRRAFSQAGSATPAVLRANWRTILFPIRLVPTSVVLALIALVALAMILYPPVDETAEPATIGGQDVPSSLHCQEDESIGFVGVPDTLVCVHVDNYAEQDAGGCTRPAFYAEAIGICVLAYPPASTPAPSATAPSAGATIALSPPAIIGSPSAGTGGID